MDRDSCCVADAEKQAEEVMRHMSNAESTRNMLQGRMISAVQGGMDTIHAWPGTEDDVELDGQSSWLPTQASTYAGSVSGTASVKAELQEDPGAKKKASIAKAKSKVLLYKKTEDAAKPGSTKAGAPKAASESSESKS